MTATHIVSTHSILKELTAQGHCWLPRLDQKPLDRQIIHEFFERPLGQKLSHQRRPRDGIRPLCGFNPYGQEHFGDCGRPDMNESIVVSLEDDDRPWSEQAQISGIRAWLRTVAPIYEQLSQRLADAIGWPGLRFAGHSFTQINWYPPLAELPLRGPDGLRVAAHTDPGFLVAFPNGIGSHVEFRSPVDGTWRCFDARDEVLIFAGDLLEQISGGTILALPHRVAAPSDDRSTRISLNLETLPTPDSIVSTSGMTCRQHMLHNLERTATSPRAVDIPRPTTTAVPALWHRTSTLSPAPSRVWISAYAVERDELDETLTELVPRLMPHSRLVIETLVPTSSSRAALELGFGAMPSSLIYLHLAGGDRTAFCDLLYANLDLARAHISMLVDQLSPDFPTWMSHIEALRAEARDRCIDEEHFIAYFGGGSIPSHDPRERVRQTARRHGLGVVSELTEGNLSTMEFESLPGNCSS